MAITTILQQISILAILALAGIIAVKTGILQDQARAAIEKLVFYITLPLLIITKLSVLEITAEILHNGIFVIVITYLILFLQIVIGRISARIFRLPRDQAVIHGLHTFLGNIVFLGFPLLDALFPGGEAILYAALYQLVMNSVMWTYGIVRLNPGSSRKENFKKLANPNTIALVLALVMMIFGIRLPETFQIALGGLGSTTLYLAMIYIGILLAGTKFLKMIRKTDVLFLSFNKLILIPFLLLLLFYTVFKFTGFQLDAIVLSVLVLEASMPCMTILVLLAKRFGADDQKAMENFVVSTVFSVLSLPLVMLALQQLIEHFQ